MGARSCIWRIVCCNFYVFIMACGCQVGTDRATRCRQPRCGSSGAVAVEAAVIGGADARVKPFVCVFVSDGLAFFFGKKEVFPPIFLQPSLEHFWISSFWVGTSISLCWNPRDAKQARSVNQQAPSPRMTCCCSDGGPWFSAQNNYSTCIYVCSCPFHQTAYTCLYYRPRKNNAQCFLNLVLWDHWSADPADTSAGLRLLHSSRCGHGPWCMHPDTLRPPVVAISRFSCWGLVGRVVSCYI